MIAGLFKHTRNWLDHAFSLAPDTQPLEVAPRISVPTLIVWSEASHDWLITHTTEFADAVSRFDLELN